MSRPKAVVIGNHHANAVRPRGVTGPDDARWYWQAVRHEDNSRKTVWAGWSTREEVEFTLQQLQSLEPRKKANGQGSVDWVESKQRYRARVSLPDGTRKAVYGKTREEVERKMAAIPRTDAPHAGTLITIETGDHLTTIRWTLEGVEIAHPSSRTAAEVVGDVLELFQHLAAVTAAPAVRSVSRG